ncbi:MAG: hypothetical protein DRJ51_05855 [Thermoprotei archaeon]|nr:MAG: hypothetical protein DRJ51_05855 [Thermoprotei archaeon]
MARRRRSRLRILVDILQSIERESGVRITQILYSANLPYDRLVRYLNELKKKGLIKEVREEGAVKYFLTKKGFEFLSEFRRIERFAEAFGIEL